MGNKRNFVLGSLLSATAIGVVSLFCTPLANAQSAQSVISNQSSVAAPGRVSSQLDKKTDAYMSTGSSSVKVKDVKLSEPPVGAENIKFALTDLQIDNVVSYDSDELFATYSDYIGTEISLATLYKIADELTLKYRNDGYLLTQVIVPVQTIDKGRAKLQVVEGYIADVTIEADENISTDLIEEYASRLKTEGKALNVAEMERVLLLINDLPGITARSVLSPSTKDIGAANLTIFVERDSYESTVAINNYGSRYLGPGQASAAFAVNDTILQENERILVQAATAPDLDEGSEFIYGSLSYEQPIFDNGTKLNLSGSYTTTEPGFDLQEFDVEGRSTYFSAGISYPLVRTRNFNISTRANFDIRNVASENNIEETRKDKIRAARIGSTMDFIDNILSLPAITSLSVDVSKGLGVLGASEKGYDNTSRALGDSEFLKMETTLSRLQRINSSVSIMALLNTQISDHSLLSSEEFGVGGSTIGRGYDPSEIIGDSGLSGTIEVRWREPYAIEALPDYHVFGFFDGGRVWNRDPATSKLARETLTSAGAGVRAEILGDVAGEVVIAFPLNREVETQDNKHPRVLFSLSKNF